MLQKYFVSAYATSQVLKTWDEASETAYFQALAASALIIGVELPYLLDREAYPIDWLLKNIPEHWHLNITSLPAVMQLAAKNPKAGLASTSEPDRKIAVELFQKARCYADKLQQALGRPVIQSINLYSSPSLFSNSTQTAADFVVSAPSPSSALARLKADFHQRSAEALERSLIEIKKMNWGLIALNLEHCDAFVSSHPPEKGFLSLDEEIEVLKRVGDIGLVLNWGRSAIETRSVEGPLQHLRQALSHQLLRGFVFSGCTADPNSLYGAWKDRHAPPAPLCRESLLGKKEMMQVLEETKKENQELSLGIKISNRFVPFDIKRSIELNLETINLLENMMRDCRIA